jgi:ribonuclease HI
LMGVIQGYHFLKTKHADACYIRIYTDSQYIYLAVTQYLAKWMQDQSWQTRARKPVKNRDLWQEIIVILQGCDTISWRWINREKNIKAHLVAEQGLNL